MTRRKPFGYLYRCPTCASHASEREGDECQKCYTRTLFVLVGLDPDCTTFNHSQPIGATDRPAKP